MFILINYLPITGTFSAFLAHQLTSVVSLLAHPV